MDISDCRAEGFVICKYPATCIVKLMPLLTEEVVSSCELFFRDFLLLNEMRRYGSHMLYYGISVFSSLSSLKVFLCI